MPCKLPGVRERLEVWDGPLVAVGAAGADEVAQQVQVEADEDEQRGQPWVRRRSARRLSAANGWAEGEACEWAGDEERRNGADNRERQAVQRMVILRKPQQGMRRMAESEAPGQCQGHRDRARRLRRLPALSRGG